MYNAKYIETTCSDGLVLLPAAPIGSTSVWTNTSSSSQTVNVRLWNSNGNASVSNPPVAIGSTLTNYNNTLIGGGISQSSAFCVQNLSDWTPS